MNFWSVVFCRWWGIALVCDLRTRDLPTRFRCRSCGLACLATVPGLHKVTWIGLIAGASIGLGLSDYGLPQAERRGDGAADALLLALRCWAAPFTILAWMAFAGGILALAALARGKRDFAYAPAIAVGVLIETVWPGGLAHVLLG